jgi:hypothetical protein
MKNRISMLWLSSGKRIARNVGVAGVILLSLFSTRPAVAADALLPMQVLSLDSQISLIERNEGPAAELGIFIGSEPNELRLRKVSLRIDDHEPTVYEYGEAEWNAISTGGLHPALLMPLEPGTHRLRLELFARTVDAGPTDPRAVERLDQAIEIPAGQTLMEITMAQQRFGKSSLGVRQVNGADGSGMWQRAARFWLDADRPYAAARLLTRLQSRGYGAQDGGALLSESLARLSGQGVGTSIPAASLASFNAAVGGSGDGQNLVALEAIGQQKARTQADWTLRDHANLLLGYAYLRGGNGPSAIEAFSRVRSPGPYGNAALLGFGWSFLVPESGAPTGTRPMSPAFDGRPVFITAIERRVINKGPDKDRKKALERALVPWTELIGRDPLDIDAQEGALALAWALDQLGTGAQAHTYYERAAKQLELARAQLEEAMAHVGSGRAANAVATGQNDDSSGWRVWLADLPYADDTGYLKYLLADDGFVAVLDQYRGARLLSDELARCEKRLEAVPASEALSNAVQAAMVRAQASEKGARMAFERRALDLLRARRLQTERYLVEARFAIARHYDSAPPPETELKRGSSSDGDPS